MPNDRYEPPALDRLDQPVPPVRFLSNGRYTVLITGAGTGVSWCDGYALNAWSADRIEDSEGFSVFLREEGRGFRSVGVRPAGAGASRFSAAWSPGIFRLTREDGGIETSLEIFVPPGERAEIRRLALTNLTDEPRRIEITTSIEPVLNDTLAHRVHPAFSKLFLETEIVPQKRAILCRRRPRAAGEAHPFMFHALLGEGPAEYETDRELFVGRSRPPGAPRALERGEALTASAGCVIEPVLALRTVAPLGPHGSAAVAFALGLGDSRADALASVSRLQATGAVEAFRDTARRNALEDLRKSGTDEACAARDQALAGAALYGDPALRAPADVLARIALPAETLSRFGLSPYRAYAVFRADEAAPSDEIERMGCSWRSLALPIDLVLLVKKGAAPKMDGFRLIRLEELSPGELDLIEAGARLVFPLRHAAARVR